MSEIETAQAALIREFQELGDGFEQYAYLIELAALLPPMAPEEKTEERLVRGCQSHVWLALRSENGRFYATADSDTFIVKGVLSPQDAEESVKAGAAGLVVSHHHGMMQYSVPPLMVLPDILSAVGGSVPVFVDCGIESGMDAYKCLALGATAVSVGRHLMPLLKQGPDAVAARIKEMTAELAGVMARTGVKSLKDIDPSVIHKRTF